MDESELRVRNKRIQKDKGKGLKAMRVRGIAVSSEVKMEKIN